MTDVLQIGASALLAYQQSIATTGQNIANASTPGYTRQRTELVSRVGGASGAGFSGTGVSVSGVTRLADSYATSRLLNDAAAGGAATRYQTMAANVDKLLSDSSVGLSSALNSFFTAVDGVAADPSSTAARQTLIGSAQTLSSRFNGLQSQLDSLGSEVNTRLQQAVGQVNTLTTSIAQINDRIAQVRGAGGSTNELQDQRAQLLTQLAAQIGVSTAEQGDGTLNVYAANGQALVLGTHSTPLTAHANPSDPSQLDVYLGSGASEIPLGERVSGGEIGGLLDFRANVLQPAQGELGRIGVALAQSFNAQNAEGLDLYGNAGGNFFSVPAPTVAGSAGAAASVSAAYVDAGALTGGDYTLRYTGSAWQLADGNGAAVPMTGNGSAGNPFVAAGLSFTISGAPASGDSYRITSTADARLSVAVSDPGRIAAASLVRSSATVANAGSGRISAPQVLDASNPALRTATTLQFTSANTYSINGSGSYAYTPGGDIDVNGWRVQISGTPASGDSFQVLPTAAGSADNGNASALAALRNSGVIAGGTVSVSAGYTALVARAGSQAQQAQQTVDAQTALTAADQSQRDSISGVNLDEEAANLLRFQQAYQAAAQVISVANSMFDTLINAVR